MKVHFVYIILLALTFSSCDRIAKNVDPPPIEAQLVVNSFLSPEESFIKIEVSLSKPVFGKKSSTGNAIDYITDATVVITNDGGLSYTLPFQDSVNAYYVNQSVYPIEAERTYTIKVNGAGKTVSATTTIPRSIVYFDNVTYKTFQSSGNGITPNYIYTYKWYDEPGEKNYYRIETESKYIYEYEPGFIDSFETTIDNTMWDATNSDGSLLTATCEDYTSYYGDSLQRIDIYLLNTDIHYYEYHKRRINYYGDDPFSEPTQQYSNVTGGLGVVCSYRKSSKSIFVPITY